MSRPYFKVRLFSHHFVITEPAPGALALIDGFARNYVQYRLEKINRRFMRTPSKVFACKLTDGSEFRFHIEQWQPFGRYLINNGVKPENYEVVLEPVPEGVDIEIDTQWKEKDYQVPIGEYLISETPSKSKLLEIQTGRGKSLSVDALVKIPGGWQRFGDLVVGDFVLGKDGNPSEVTGVYPQGLKDCCEIVFEDGRSVPCCTEHFWNIYSSATGIPLAKTLMTWQIKELLDSGEKVYVDLVESEQGPYLILPKDPYVIAQELLVNEKAYDEKMVMSFFEGSHRQRLAFAQGFLDNIKNLTNDDHVLCFSVKTEKLARWIQYLIRSLGGICSVDVDKNDRWLLRIIYQKPSLLFKKTQRVAWASALDAASSGSKLEVISIESLGKGETVCISVDNQDKEFVVNDFVATHNTFCAVKAACRLKKRIGVVIRPQFIEKWKSDFKEICGFDDDDILIAQGSGSLKKILHKAATGELVEKVIIFSNRTLQNWYSLYEDRGQSILKDGYACLPQELFPLLGIGFRIIDEVHQDFHLFFKVDLYTHVDRSVSLSATLKHDDAFMNRMYELAYPVAKRYAGLAYDRYVVAYSWIYHVRRPEILRWTEYGSMAYSHHVFERTIMKYDALLSSYLEMIADCVSRFYAKSPDYIQGDRLLVYCASIEMCTRVTAYLKQILPEKDIRRYVEDDPYENLMEAEISVSTLLSAGTAHDIDRLTTVILTTAILSHQSNVQGLGRLRKITGRTVRFIYMACADVPKQIDYHLRKKDLLKMLAADYNTMTYPHVLG